MSRGMIGSDSASYGSPTSSGTISASASHSATTRSDRPPQSVGCHHIDLHSEKVDQREPETDLIEQACLVAELDDEVDVRPWLVLAPARGADQSRLASVVLGDQCLDLVAVPAWPRTVLYRNLRHHAATK